MNRKTIFKLYLRENFQNKDTYLVLQDMDVEEMTATLSPGVPGVEIKIESVEVKGGPMWSYCFEHSRLPKQTLVSNVLLSPSTIEDQLSLIYGSGDWLESDLADSLRVVLKGWGTWGRSSSQPWVGDLDGISYCLSSNRFGLVTLVVASKAKITQELVPKTAFRSVDLLTRLAGEHRLYHKEK